MPSVNLKAHLLFVLLSGASVRAEETVWSAFAFVLNGERTPSIGPSTSDSSLTPLGAQQMLTQGSVLRRRWLANPNTTATNTSGESTTAPIAGIERIAIDNSELSIYSSKDSYATAGALAFMQGLYPPTSQAFSAGNGGQEAAILANGSLIDFPLDGYMYPNIHTVSISDPESVWLQGHVSCTEYYKATGSIRGDPRIDELYNATPRHYQELLTTVFDGTLPVSMASFAYADDIYDYALYQYTHNETIQQRLNMSDITWLAEMASIQQFAKNGDLSISGNTEGDSIRAIAGRTLSAKVVTQFQSHISSRGHGNKLTLMFGSYQPMLAFFSLSGLSHGQSSGLFQEMPLAGAAMVFELFSETDATDFPDTDDLWVRFLYRNSTDEDAPLYKYPLFGNGLSEDRIKYRDFTTSIHQFSINDMSTWCDTCDAVALFCNGVNRNSAGGTTTTQRGRRTSSLSPAVAGAIGAVAAIAAIVLGAVLLAWFGGFRFTRLKTGRQSSLGGFKGAEKMKSDNDVSIARNGARHERVGSWELGGPGRPPISEDTSADLKNEPTFGASLTRDAEDDTDSIIMSRAPVKPFQSV
ncbi:hypothetical protein JX265_012183 [Neoarthrinium moseri]|uniref:Histidine acid phosphatase n=1 Tax=Neoarthrinium moseri TaxID=1658444 RepID=A0A9Q0AJZ5_9PEZI|nr:hypothetical protein JX266_010598 [Neoarthrinium moseri]KAI1855738.1 hypothetical protein JX265_012183 [Neoarthrinium moseri]